MNHYSHGIETIDFIKAKLSKDEFKGFIKGNMIKYISRANFKGTEYQDYKKVLYYSELLIKCDKQYYE